MVTATLQIPLSRAGLSQIEATIDEPVAANTGAGEPDEALIVAIAAGDVTALDQLYRRYRAVAFAVACKVLQDPAAAEDVVHDAFLRFWRAASSFQPGRGSPRVWLLTIFRNAAIDSLRARELAWRPRPIFASFESLASVDEDICLTVAAAADACRVARALTTLPREQRDAIELAYFGGLTHGQIAERTGVPLGTVKGRVRLGLRRLRQELQDLAPATHGTSDQMHSARMIQIASIPRMTERYQTHTTDST